MSDEELAAQRPADIDEAVVCMERTLAEFNARDDRRAFFLHVYLLMTRAVKAAIDRTGKFEQQPVFMDPGWVRKLSGRFASRYFASIVIADDVPGNWAWRAAHREARKPGSAVLLDVVLGINAHINYDLAQAIADNLDPAELDDASAMRRRKFDHDQVNNLLNGSIDSIQDMLAKNYDPSLGFADRMLGRFDEQLSQIGLKHYRQQVWENALTYAAALAEDEADRKDGHAARGCGELVRAKLDWESKHLAEEILSWGVVWHAERHLADMWKILKRLT